MDTADACFSEPIGRGIAHGAATPISVARVRRLEQQLADALAENETLRAEVDEHRERERNLLLAVLDADALTQGWAVVAQRLKRGLGARP